MHSATPRLAPPASPAALTGAHYSLRGETDALGRPLDPESYDVAPCCAHCGREGIELVLAIQPGEECCQACCDAAVLEHEELLLLTDLVREWTGSTTEARGAA